jgi:hypothetical protein
MTTERLTPRIAEAVALLVATYPVPAWSDETADAYCTFLADLEPDAVQAAVVAWIQAHDQRPSVAALRAAVRRQLEGAEVIPLELEPEDAWGYVVKCFSRVGRYRDFAGRPLVMRAVEIIGWETLCDSDNPEADRAHFLRVYAALLTRTREQRHTAAGLRLEGDEQRLLTDKSRG